MQKRKIRKIRDVPFVRLSDGREITFEGVIRYPNKQKLPFLFNLQTTLKL